MSNTVQRDRRPHSGFTASNSGVIAGLRLLLVSIATLPLMRAAPTSHNPFIFFAEDEEPPMSPKAPTLWIYLAVAVALVLLGGAFAGLTIALMGQV